MNGFFDDGLEDHAELIWSYCKVFARLDGQSSVNPRGAEGSELDKIMAAKLLELHDETMTYEDRKAALQEIDVNNDGLMSFVEYLIWKFGKGVDETVNAKQGKSQEIAACQAVIDRALAMLPEIEAKLEAQRAAQREVDAALAEVRAAKAEAEAALVVLQAAEAELQAAVDKLAAARAELQAAVDELARQEQAKLDEIARLEQLQADPTVGIVKRGMASNKLLALKDEDPLPLRKAKITQEAALRAVQKRERAAAAAQAEAAAKTAEHQAKVTELEKKEAELEARRAELATAIAELEASYTEMEKRMHEAHAALEELKQSRCGLGAVWWMERELYEADESLPRSKQKYDHSRPFVMSDQPATDGKAAGRRNRKSWIGGDIDVLAMQKPVAPAPEIVVKAVSG